MAEAAHKPKKMGKTQTYFLIGGGLLAAYLLYRYYKSKQASATTGQSQMNPTDRAAADYAALAGTEQADIAALKNQIAQQNAAQHRYDLALWRQIVNWEREFKEQAGGHKPHHRGPGEPPWWKGDWDPGRPHRNDRRRDERQRDRRREERSDDRHQRAHRERQQDRHAHTGGAPVGPDRRHDRAGGGHERMPHTPHHHHDHIASRSQGQKPGVRGPYQHPNVFTTTHPVSHRAPSPGNPASEIDRIPQEIARLFEDRTQTTHPQGHNPRRRKH